MSDELVTDAPKWKCAGCGKPGLERTCDCVTDVVCRVMPGSYHEHTIKTEPPITSDIERCALLAEMYRNDTRSGWVEYNRGWESACVAIAAAIRALRAQDGRL